MTPQLALRIAIVGVPRLALFAISSSGSGTCRSCRATTTWREALDNRVRKVARPGTARRDPRPRRQRDRHQPRGDRRAARPAALPASHRDAALEWGQQMTLRETLPKGHRGEPVPIPPAPPQLEARLKSLGRVIGMSARSINDRDRPQLAVTPYANIRVRVDVPQTMRNYLLEHQRAASPESPSSRSTCAAIPRARQAAQLLGTTGEIEPKELHVRPLPRRGRRAPHRQGRDRMVLRQLPARRAAACRGITIDARGTAKGQRIARDPRPGDQLRTSLDLSLQQTGQRALAAARSSGGPGTAGGIRRARPAQRPDPRAELISDIHAERALEADLAAALRRDLRQAGGLAAVQPRDRRRLSDGLDVQADHGAGGARARA